MQQKLNDQIFYYLKKIPSPNIEVNIVDAGLVSKAFITHDKIYLSINVIPAPDGFFEQLIQIIKNKLSVIAPDYQAIISLTKEKKTLDSEKFSTKTLPTPQALPGVKFIIAVASGKGGVGKSTIAFNLSLALAKQGLKVGLMDADIYGPSLPLLTGLKQKPAVDDNKRLIPLQAWGLKLMSIGFLINQNEAAIWRGPMVMGAVRQMLKEVSWAPLDILVIDMPPGTGDAQLTIIQQIKLDGAIIVSTPQEMALVDARRAITMFNKLAINILGIIENMSYFVAPDTGVSYDIFGKGGAKNLASQQNIKFLAELPFSLPLRTSADAGEPLVQQIEQQHDICEINKNFVEIAAQIMQNLLSNRGTENER
ncbi:Mrp/NBP35 family ATP-binding protein [Bartonella sp. DGB1]|uniref:Mrp/NBP35 family ATP-binding protein n=1 Tax=Bartonella sp. DGB1 TaxID=3239807 RepID=UPI00352365B8